MENDGEWCIGGKARGTESPWGWGSGERRGELAAPVLVILHHCLEVLHGLGLRSAYGIFSVNVENSHPYTCSKASSVEKHPNSLKQVTQLW